MLRIRAGKTSICFDFTFFAAIGIYLLIDRTGYAILCFFACLLHEAGHLVTIGVLGLSAEEITFCGGGIRIKNSIDSVLVLISGCFVNFCLFYIFIGCKNDIFSITFALSNFLVGILNMLPIGSFDGFRILEILVNKLFDIDKAYRIINIVKYIFNCLSITAIIILFSLSYLNFTVFAVAIYMIILEFTRKMR